MARNGVRTLVATLMLSATPLIAQDTAETETSDTPALDMGQTVQEGERPLGQRYLKETFTDWELACISTEAEVDPCSMLQVMTDPNGQPMAEMTLFRLENGQAEAAATVIVPLETLLPAQLTISIDGSLAKRYSYQYCTPVGCVAQIGLSGDDVAAMKAANEAIVSIVPAPAPDQRIDLRLSLAGFTAAYAVVDIVPN